MPNQEGQQLIDKRRKGWFWEYNDVFGSDLSAFAKLVRLYLARCADKERQAWPSYSKMAKDCGISRDSVKRAVDELAESGWIVKHVRIQDGECLPNHYHLCDPPNTAAKDDENGGGCSQHLPCRHTTGGVGAHSTQVDAQDTQVGAHNIRRVGAYSTQVGAEADCNNTHGIIPMEVQQQQPISDHRSIVDWTTSDKNDVVVVDRSTQVVLSTEPGEKHTATQQPINRDEKKESSARPESKDGELTGNPIRPIAGATLTESEPNRDQLDKIVALIKDTAGIKFTLDAARALFYAGKGDMERVCKALQGAGVEYRRRKGGKDRVHNEMGWFVNAVIKGFVPTVEDKYQDISIT
jgi:biotin operon repressor